MSGDCRAILPALEAESFDCIVTSPPYWGLRDYGVAGQIGIEPTLDDYVETMVGVCRELKRVLNPEGTFWLNLGDSYSMTTKGSSGKGEKQVTNAGTILADRRWAIQRGLKPKDLCGVPWRVAFALQADGWWLRSAIVWAKPNPMPESVTDRPTSAYEMVFLLTKSERYFYDADAIAEEGSGRIPGNKTPTARRDTGIETAAEGHGIFAAQQRRCDTRNARNVWTIATQPFKGSHFATMPPDLAERCIKAGCPRGGHVLDPFGGAGTTGLVADRLGRHATLIELSPGYRNMTAARITDDAPLFAEVVQ
jgi:DNA modification methylase